MQPHPTPQMVTHVVIGVDPGEVTGIAALALSNMEIKAKTRIARPNVAAVVQCDPYSVWLIVQAIGTAYAARGAHVLVAVEKWQEGHRAHARRDGGHRHAPVQVIGDVHAGALAESWVYVERSAAAVKPWAADERLARAELLEPTKNMRHARDAFRHALMAACSYALADDPMAKPAVTR